MVKIIQAHLKLRDEKFDPRCHLMNSRDSKFDSRCHLINSRDGKFDTRCRFSNSEMVNLTLDVTGC